MTGVVTIGRLPEGWSEGLPDEVVERVLFLERWADRGLMRLYGPDHKGYLWVQLCLHHPYANRNSTQRLHRYLMMRSLGRRLEHYEHVHHDPAAPKDTADIRHLSLREATDHGHYHYGERVRCGHHLELWAPRDVFGRFTPLPTNESIRAALEEL